MEASKVIRRLAKRHGLKAVGIARRPSVGEGYYREAFQILVLAPLTSRREFADEVAERFGVDVHLYDPLALPYSHPLHFSVRWLICERLPRVPVPRGGVLRELAGRNVNIPFREVLHFHECDNPEQPSGQPFLIVDAPPLGGFLL